MSQPPSNEQLSVAGSEMRPSGRDEVIDAAIRAAAELFATRNPSQVTIREIAAQAGVSHALIHRYLGSKENILTAVLEFDRHQAAEYWTVTHGLGKTTQTFEEQLPPGRYLRTIMRAALEGTPLAMTELKLPHTANMTRMVGRIPTLVAEDTRGFDPRLLVSAATAMTAGMAVAEDFFLVQTGLEGDDREEIRAELDRLAMRILSLAENSESAKAD